MVEELPATPHVLHQSVPMIRKRAGICCEGSLGRRSPKIEPTFLCIGIGEGDSIFGTQATRSQTCKALAVEVYSEKD